jgi:hypothetical protein
VKSGIISATLALGDREQCERTCKTLPSTSEVMGSLVSVYIHTQVSTQAPSIFIPDFEIEPFYAHFFVGYTYRDVIIQKLIHEAFPAVFSPLIITFGDPSILNLLNPFWSFYVSHI